MRRGYDFTSRWVVPASVERCWALCEQSLVSGEVPWWPSVRIVPGARAPAVGDVRHLEVRSPWGYRLRVALTVTEVRPPHLLAATSTGDLVGIGRLAIAARPGSPADGAELTWIWRVELARRWMRLAAPVLRPAFVAAHRLVMRRGERGLRAALAGASEIRNPDNTGVSGRRRRGRRYREAP